MFREKYFRPAYNFIASVLHRAQDKYGCSATIDESKSVEYTDVTLVGIHIRRQDMLVEENVYHGYRTAPLSYFVRAMLYFARKYLNVHFVVVSDDILWAKSQLPQSYDSVSFSDQGFDSPIDLAILSLCNHTIGSVGTFSWWGAWLAGGGATQGVIHGAAQKALQEPARGSARGAKAKQGAVEGTTQHPVTGRHHKIQSEVIMYAQPVQEGSRLHKEGFKQQDFFPPTWKLLK